MTSNKLDSLTLSLKNLTKQWVNSNYDTVEFPFPYDYDIYKTNSKYLPNLVSY